jgi:hypothetical protein
MRYCEKPGRAAGKAMVASTLTIAVYPSDNPYFHQARLWIDGKDWLGPECAGLDPPKLAAELLGTSERITVGRCWNDIVGCHDRTVKVTRTERSVHWSHFGGIRLRFDGPQYDAEVARFAQDRSWESLERKAGREINQVFRGTTIKGGFEFISSEPSRQERLVRLYFGRGTRSKPLKFKWDGTTLADAVNQAKLFRAERFSHCR